MSKNREVATIKPGITVLRRQGTFAGAWAMMALIGMIGGGSLVLGIQNGSRGDMIVWAADLLAMARMCWRAMGRARLELHSDKLCVIGPMMRYRVPLSSVASLEADLGLGIVTVQGDSIPVFAFAPSLIDRGRTVRAAAAPIRRVLPRKPVPRGTAPPVSRAVDLSWADITFVPFAVTTIAILLGFL